MSYHRCRCRRHCCWHQRNCCCCGCCFRLAGCSFALPFTCVKCVCTNNNSNNHNSCVCVCGRAKRRTSSCVTREHARLPTIRIRAYEGAAAAAASCQWRCCHLLSRFGEATTVTSRRSRKKGKKSVSGGFLDTACPARPSASSAACLELLPFCMTYFALTFRTDAVAAAAAVVTVTAVPAAPAVADSEAV